LLIDSSKVVVHLGVDPFIPQVLQADIDLSIKVESEIVNLMTRTALAIAVMTQGFVEHPSEVTGI